MFKSIYSLCIAMCVALFSFGQDCANQYTTDIASTVSMTTVQYGSAINAQGANQDLFMDIYQGDGDTDIDKPVMILAFGGSFIGGTRDSEDMVYFATEFAKKGYVCASIDYRLASSAFDLFSEEALVKTVIRAIHDGKGAIRFFREDADGDNTYKIDPNKIFIGGTSAGGILAVNLAYMDDPEKLPTNWQTWAEELGGLEGESGSAGYCSKANGVFSFAGAVVDTAWIENDDVPIYSTHSTGDGTVPYGYGSPLGGIAPITVYGSGPLHARMENIGTHNVLDTYTDNAHPPFATNDQQENEQRLADIEDHLTTFLHEIMVCNPNNLLQNNVDVCSTTSSIGETGSTFENSFYPNPARDHISFDSNQHIMIFSATGVKVIDKDVKANKSINISHLNSGIYLIEATEGNSTKTSQLIKL